MNKLIAIIPSRYGSSRFPGKPLALLKGKPMIQHVYEHVQNVSLIDNVYVATDDKRILRTVESFGGQAIMTSDRHTCGTERLAECSQILALKDNDLILNIQGDEPLIRPEMILDLIRCFDNDDVYMGTLKKEITKASELQNPNVVKVICDQNNQALYFSRYCLPYEREKHRATHYKHIGVYGYKKWFLMKYSNMSQTPLEISESLEQLRVLENGYKIQVRETAYQTIGVDTPEQLVQVETLMEEY